MSTGNEEEVLDFKIGLDIRDALRNIVAVNRELSAAIQSLGKETKKAGDASEKANKKSKKDQKEVAKAYVETSAKVRGLKATIEALAEEASSASDDEKSAIAGRIADLQKELDVRRKSEALESRRHKSLLSRAKEAGKLAKAEIKRAKEAGGAREYAKDLATRAGRGSAAGLIKKGRSMSKGGGGIASKVGGEALIGLGKTLSGVMKMVNLVGGGFMGMFKLFLDANAMVKEFNRNILESASTSGFMAKGAKGMELALDGVRDAAYDAKFNLEWGTTKDTHIAVMNTLTQEGLALDKMQDQAGNTREGMTDLSQQIVATSVAYSRNWGVAISEVSQLQAQMMVDMGASAKETTQAFSMITQGANESGIAGNRFFAMVKNMSQDLSMWNMRMEDSVSLLSKLGKVMNPKDAEKFLQNINGAYKQMGSDDRLKTSLFMGTGKAKALVNRDFDRQAEGMAKKLAEATGGSADDILKRFKEGGTSAIQADINKLSGEKQGTVSSEFTDLELRRNQAKQGTYGVAQALGGLSVGGALEAKIASLSALGQGTDISKNIGSLGRTKTAEALGVQEEELFMLAKMQKMIEAQRDTLKAKATSDEERKKIEGMGYDEIANTMSKEMREAAGLDKANSVDEQVRDLAKEQGWMTQDIMQSIDVIKDWLMNTFYNIIMGIWKAIKSFVIGGNDAVEEKVLTSKNSAVSKAWTAAAGNEAAFKQNLFQSGGAATDFSLKLGDALKGDKAEEIKSKILGGVNMRELPDAMRSAGITPDALSVVNPMEALKKLKPEDQAKVFHRLAGRMDTSKLVDLVDSFGSGPAVKTAADLDPSKKKMPASVKKPLEVQKKTLEEAKTQTEVQETGAANVQAAAEGTTKAVKDMPKEIGSETLEAIRTALYEYYLYKDMDKSVMAKAVGAGGLTGVMSSMKSAATSNGAAGITQAITDIATRDPKGPHAKGGMVTGIANGMAIVAAQGEGLTSIGKGERIVPAGGGGGGGSPVQVNVNGIGGKDLAKVIENKVIEGIREFKNKERLQ